MATVASHKRLFTYYQCDTNNNHKYYQEFCAHVETLETYGDIGAVGITPTFLTAKLKDFALEKVIQDAKNPTDAERLIAIKQCCDEFLGCLMLSGANQERYAALKSDLNNQYGFGKDLYPKSPDLCLSLLNRRLDVPLRQPRQNFQTPPQVKQEEEALVFAQGASDKKTSMKSQHQTQLLSVSRLWQLRLESLETLFLLTDVEFLIHGPTMTWNPLFHNLWHLTQMFLLSFRG